jgi:hypothetical protein
VLRKTRHSELVEEVQGMILTNHQFDLFYGDDIPRISFEEMSTAKYKDYEKTREKIYAAIG